MDRRVVGDVLQFSHGADEVARERLSSRARAIGRHYEAAGGALIGGMLRSFLGAAMTVTRRGQGEIRGSWQKSEAWSQAAESWEGSSLLCNQSWIGVGGGMRGDVGRRPFRSGASGYRPWKMIRPYHGEKTPPTIAVEAREDSRHRLCFAEESLYVARGAGEASKEEAPEDGEDARILPVEVVATGRLTLEFRNAGKVCASHL